MASYQPKERLPKVKADPVAELPIYNFKYVKNTEELHMANRGIDKIRGFEQFPVLEVLWLQDNQITSLNHLDENFRLKRLYVSGNKIQTLKGSSLRYLNSLEVLLLANNQITDLKVQLKELQKLPCLQQLELIGNPVAEETNYRYLVIHRCPNIHILDRHVVTDVERLQAAKLAKELEWDKKPPASMPEDIDLTLFREGQPVKLTKRGVHLKEAKLPRMWRKRPCFSRTFEPPKIRPTKWKGTVASQAEKDLDEVNSEILAWRRKRDFEVEQSLYKAVWWDKPGIGFVGPNHPQKQSFQADAAAGLNDDSTARIQAFTDDLKFTREHIHYEHYPPWDPPPQGPEPLAKHLQKTKKVSAPKKKEPAATPERAESPTTTEGGLREPDMTIQIDRKLFKDFRLTKAKKAPVKFGTAKYHL